MVHGVEQALGPSLSSLTSLACFVGFEDTNLLVLGTFGRVHTPAAAVEQGESQLRQVAC